MKKIVIISPVLPYRGGIAQYGDALLENLRKVADVSIVSYKRLYPEFLYPGKSDKVDGGEKKWQKNINYILDALSPLSINRTINIINKEKPDLVIAAWWTFFWQPALGYIAWRLRKRNTKVMFLCHNVVDHDSNFLKRFISTNALKAATSYIVHSNEEASKIKKIKPNADLLQRPHPIYTHFPEPTKKLKKRGRIELLYFGLIRPYKGVDVLINAMRLLDDSTVHLTIVGEVWGKENKQKLKDKIKQSNANIEYNFSFVNEVDAANYFGRADVVVLPYLSATGSGVITLAYNYGKPVIATAVGGLPDVVNQGKTGWLISPKSAPELARTIQAIKRSDIPPMKKNISKFCEENSWDKMALSIKEFSDITTKKYNAEFKLQ